MAGVLNRYGKRENIAPMSTLFFARLGPMMKEEHLKDICSEYGEVEEVTMVCDRETKRSKGCAFVKFKSADDAKQCLSAMSEITNKHHWIIEWAKSTQIRDTDLDKRTLYITGLTNENADDQSVYDYFSEYGTVEKVTVVGKNADFPPYAFVKFTDERYASNALKNENGKYWNGNQLIIQYSETLESKKSRRLHRVVNKQQNGSYTNIQKETKTKSVAKEKEKESFLDENGGSLITSLLSAFGSLESLLTIPSCFNSLMSGSSSVNSQPIEETGDVLIRRNMKEIKQADSPLLQNYEKLIHQLDDDDYHGEDYSLLDEKIVTVNDEKSFFLDDDVWGPYQ